VQAIWMLRQLVFYRSQVNTPGLWRPGNRSRTGTPPFLFEGIPVESVQETLLHELIGYRNCWRLL
jgi:hypothetical protein